MNKDIEELLSEGLPTTKQLNRELKRRAKVIGVFPNAESLLRLIGSVLIEEHEKMQSKKYRTFYRPTYLKVLEISEKLEEIAKEQRRQLVA